jgi:hypothetical protein
MKRRYCAWIASGTRRIGDTIAPLAHILADGLIGLTRTLRTLAPPRQARYMIQQVLAKCLQRNLRSRS